MASEKIYNMLKGNQARLFPVLSESKREEKATSILLSVFKIVPDFAKTVLSEAGAKIGKRSTTKVLYGSIIQGSEAERSP